MILDGHIGILYQISGDFSGSVGFDISEEIEYTFLIN